VVASAAAALAATALAFQGDQAYASRCRTHALQLYECVA